MCCDFGCKHKGWKFNLQNIGIRISLHKTHSSFLDSLIDWRHLSFVDVSDKGPLDRQTSCLHCWKGVFRCAVHKTQGRRLDAEDYNCVSPMRVFRYFVLPSLSVYYTPSASDRRLCQPFRECIKSVWVHMSVLLLYSMSMQQLISWLEQSV